MVEVQLTTQYALVKDPRRMPRLINHPDRDPPEQRAGRTYAVVGKGGATVRAAASLRSPVVGTVERGGKVDVVEERRARCRVAAPVAGWVSAKVLAPHATDQVAAAVTVTTASTGVVPRPVDPEAFEDPAVVTAATRARRPRAVRGARRRVLGGSLFLSSPGVVSQYCVSCGVRVGESEKTRAFYD